MVYELEGYNTDCRYSEDVRYRAYTSSKEKADKFSMIPKIQFTDSGHGISFNSREHYGKRKPTISTSRNHVDKFMAMTVEQISQHKTMKRLECMVAYKDKEIDALKVKLEVTERSYNENIGHLKSELAKTNPKLLDRLYSLLDEFFRDEEPDKSTSCHRFNEQAEICNHIPPFNDVCRICRLITEIKEKKGQ